MHESCLAVVLNLHKVGSKVNQTFYSNVFRLTSLRINYDTVRLEQDQAAFLEAFIDGFPLSMFFEFFHTCKFSPNPAKGKTPTFFISYLNVSCR